MGGKKEPSKNAASEVESIRDKLQATKDGGVAFQQAELLLERECDEQATKALADYALAGTFDHVREHVMSVLADRASAEDQTHSELFLKGLDLAACRYWAAKGATKTLGARVYPKLLELCRDEALPVEDRAQAIKCLATHSGQPFDRDLSADPGFWEEDDLRVEEVVAWAANGYPPGDSYPDPLRHPALDDPQSNLERLVAALDVYLAARRATEQDPANPSNWLTPSSESEIDAIRTRWDLPPVYLDFLTRFSPLRVHVEQHLDHEGEDFLPQLALFGAHELIERQARYEGAGWPSDLVVIADQNADPYAIRLDYGKESPVHFAFHGEGEWDFEEVAPTFEAFLARVLEALP